MYFEPIFILKMANSANIRIKAVVLYSIYEIDSLHSVQAKVFAQHPDLW